MTKEEVRNAFMQVQLAGTQVSVDLIQLGTMEALSAGKTTPEFEELRVSLAQDINVFLGAVERTRTMISLVSAPKKQRVLVMRYLEYMSIDEVAEALGHAPQHIDRLQSDALCEIARNWSD